MELTPKDRTRPSNRPGSKLLGKNLAKHKYILVLDNFLTRTLRLSFYRTLNYLKIF